VDLIAYCQMVVAPYIRARSGHWRASSEHEKGASLLEYALLVGLIAVVCIAAVTILDGEGSSVSSGGSAIR
jgi:pilus assembly protein Flp/PilA